MTSDGDKLTALQEDERDALLLDRGAVVRVVSGLRKYRAEVVKMLGARYWDGEVNAATLSAFASHIEDIEEGGEWQTDTYQTVTEDGVESEEADSSELFPEHAPECDTCPEHIHTFDVNCEACRAERLRTDVRTR
jgi:hypothetical protein